MGKATCQKVVLFLIVHSLLYVYGAAAAAAIGRKTLAVLEIRRELKQLNKPAIKTIKSEDGDTIDCVDIYKQPAFDHPLLKNHTIQMRPSIYDRENMSSSKPIQQLWHKSGSCPEGTIPVRRTQKRHLLAARSLSAPSPNMESAKLSLDKTNLGGEGLINVWNINVEGPSEATRSSIFVGRRDHFDLVTCGWMIGVWENLKAKVRKGPKLLKFLKSRMGLSSSAQLLPLEQMWSGVDRMMPARVDEVSNGLFGDNATRLYAFWGTDDGGCFNFLCSGFVQTGQAVTLGATTRVSTYGGEQMDNTTHSWWLVVENTPVGYWPGSLFKNMAGNADFIQWGGQVQNSLPGGRHTSTQMGSGHFPFEGFKKSAYFDKCIYFDTDTNIGKTPGDGYQKVVSKPTCYGISDIYPVEGGPGVGFFFGGPGGPSCDK